MTVAHDAEQDWRAVWVATLTELEQDVDAAEAVLAAVRRGDQDDLPTMLGSWAPPTGIAALPESLHERARIVLERQLRLIEDIATPPPGPDSTTRFLAGCASTRHPVGPSTSTLGTDRQPAAPFGSANG